jgi:DNA repair exonuclease SbcCD ATPase subunit
MMKLRLKGFTGIKMGPKLDRSGLDEISIDFRNGLSTFVGECGSGKSTVLECMHHYPQLVSRDGALWQHVFLRNSEKEFESDFMGNHYRSLIKMDAKSEKIEGFMWVNGAPVVNGKISAYKKYVYDVFGHPFAYFRSQFCPQRSKKTNDMQIENMTAGVFTELLGEFLNTDKYARWEDTSKQCINILTAKSTQIDTTIEALKKRMDGVQEIQNSLERLNASLAEQNTNKATLTAKLASAQRERENLKQVIAKNDVLQQQIASMRAILDDMNMNKVQEQGLIESQLSGLRITYNDLSREIEEADKVLTNEAEILAAADKEKEISISIDGLAGTIDQANTEITCAQDNIHTLELDKSALNNILSNLDNDDTVKALDNDINDNKTRISDKEKAIRDLDDNAIIKALDDFIVEKRTIIVDKEAAIITIENDRTLIDMANQVDNYKEKIKGLDCTDPRCPNDCNTCDYIAGALAAREALPDAETKLQERTATLEKSKLSLRDDINKFTAEINKANIDKAARLDIIESEKEALRVKITEFSSAIEKSNDSKKARLAVIEEDKSRLLNEIQEKEQEIKTARAALKEKTDLRDAKRQELARARLELTKYKNLSARQSEIAVAKSQKSDRGKALEENKKQGMAIAADWKAKSAVLDDQIEKQEAKVNNIAASIDDTAEIKMPGVEHLISETEALITGTEAIIARDEKGIVQLQAELSGMKDAEVEYQKAIENKNSITAGVSRWIYLKNSCGKNGFQLSEINGAAPLIVEDANNLLADAYGTIYSIKLQTHDEETGKEDLKIKIITETGEEVNLDNISGGQRTWNVQALWLAMSLLNQKKSNRQFDYFCSDEQDGAIDVENAIRFSALYKPFMKIGGFRDMFYISHKPECRAVADNTLYFEAGKNPAWQ